MSVTIKDIAKRTGVSYSTVSRALNGTASVNPQKKEEICRAAREMGYIPNPAAVQLKKARSGIIGLYVEDLEHISSPYSLFNVLRSAYEVLEKKYSIVVKAINRHIPGSLNPALYDGIITIDLSKPHKAFWDEVREKRIPLLIANCQAEYDAPIVTVDQYRAMYEAMQYLMKKGHRRIAVLEGTPDREATKLRHRGWVDAVKDAGYSPDEFRYYNGEFSYFFASRLMPEILREDPTAILCFNDDMAFAAINYARHFGKRVPEDVSVIGFDNWNRDSCEVIGLTTIDRGIEQIAKQCVSYLLRMIEGEEIKSDIYYIDARLIERNSVCEANRG